MLPVSLAEAKEQLRIDEGGDQDAEVDGFIRDAAAWVERYTGHILEARDVTEQFQGYKHAQLRAWPIAAAAVPVVAYNDANGSPVTISGAQLDLSSRPARVIPPNGSFYCFRGLLPFFTVTIRAGYEARTQVPGNLRRAMMILISAYDADREGGAVFQQAEASARSLCSDYRLRRL